ncbi:MAG: zinc-binding dehydrogenase [Bowdeniella nasicola]|nr:zinc-binding dehydrogenase [Bowdeniella nasicola]
MRSRIGRQRDGEGTIHPGDCPTSDAVVEILDTDPTRYAFVQWAPWQQYFRVPASSRCAAVKELGAQCLDREKAMRCPQFTVFHDAIGGELLETAIDQISPGGRIMICGALDGAPPANYTRMIHKDLTLRGFTVMNHLEQREKFWEQGLRWIDDGVVRPVYHSVRGLENAGRAFSSMDNATGAGRQIVECG